MGLGPRLACVLSCKQDGKQSCGRRMQISREEDLVAHRFNTRQLQVNRAWFFLRAIEASRLRIGFGTLKRDAHRLAVVLELGLGWKQRGEDKPGRDTNHRFMLPDRVR